MESTNLTYPQPNLQQDEVPLSFTFWAMLVTTGLAAGLVGGLLMRLLRMVEHLAFAYDSGGFLEGARLVSPERKVFVLLLAGVVAGSASFLLRNLKGD